MWGGFLYFEYRLVKYTPTALTLLSFLLSVLSVQGQGTLRGKVIDGDLGESLPFANIYLKSNMAVGTSSDLDGNYVLSLPAGTHVVVYSFTSFKPQEKE